MYAVVDLEGGIGHAPPPPLRHGKNIFPAIFAIKFDV